MGISSALGSSALIPSGYGFRNLIINGDFSVAQRGTSFVSGANNDDTYNLDRWTVLSDGNDIVDITQATDVPTGGLYSIGLDVETVNKKFGIIQFIEQRNLTGIQDKTVWLSFKAKTTGSSISNVKAAILSWTGTADTVTSDVVSAWGADGVTPTWATSWTAENTPANLNVTTSWAEYRVSAVMDTASIKNVAVFIWCDDTTTTLGDLLYVTDVQLEINSSPTPFERRPYGVELALCQRYYYRVTLNASNRAFCLGWADSSTVFVGTVPFPQIMRTRPTALETTGTASDYVAVGPAATATATSVPAYDGTSGDFQGTIVITASGGGLTTGRGGQIRSNTAGTSYFAWSAEL